MSVAKLTSALLNAVDALEDGAVVLGFAVLEQALNVMAAPTIATITKIFREVYKRKSNQEKKNKNYGTAAMQRLT
jgi:hypothetical protein